MERSHFLSRACFTGNFVKSETFVDQLPPDNNLHGYCTDFMAMGDINGDNGVRGI